MIDEGNDQTSPPSGNGLTVPGLPVLFPGGIGEGKQIGTLDDVRPTSPVPTAASAYHGLKAPPSILNYTPSPNQRVSKVSFVDDDRDICDIRINPVAAASDSTLQPQKESRSSPSESSDSPPTLSGSTLTPSRTRYSMCSFKDGYTPGNPFHRESIIEALSMEGSEMTLPCPVQSSTMRRTRLGRKIWKFITYVWIYVSAHWIFGILIMYLPSLYYRRVTTVFEEVQCSEQTLRNIIKESIWERHPEYDYVNTPKTTLSVGSMAPLEVKMLEQKWHHLLDSFIKEWKIMNIVSVLLLGTIASSMQIPPVFANEVVRYIAFSALICGLMSLVYGCTNIIGISIMRPVHKAVEWAKEGEQRLTMPFWNMWMFLSIPAIWLSWAFILFIMEILIFIWTINGPNDVLILPYGLNLAIRIGVTLILIAGLVYFGLVMLTLKRYGSELDDEWVQVVKCAPLPHTRRDDSFPQAPSSISINTQLSSTVSLRVA